MHGLDPWVWDMGKLPNPTAQTPALLLLCAQPGTKLHWLCSQTPETLQGDEPEVCELVIHLLGGNKKN
jgi:hypothetical protein